MKALAPILFLVASGCSGPHPAGTGPTGLAAEAPAVSSRSMANFARVAPRVKKAADEFCREQASGGEAVNCNFAMVLSSDPSAAPNAFQSKAKDGRPVITMTVSLLEQLDDDDQIATVLSHEAAHHVSGHLVRLNHRTSTDAFLPSAATRGQARNRAFELEADRVGAFICERSGFDPEKGARVFLRSAAGSDGKTSTLSSHPASARRLEAVSAASAEIARQRAAGLTPRPEYAGNPIP